MGSNSFDFMNPVHLLVWNRIMFMVVWWHLKWWRWVLCGYINLVGVVLASAGEDSWWIEGKRSALGVGATSPPHWLNRLGILPHLIYLKVISCIILPLFLMWQKLSAYLVWSCDSFHILDTLGNNKLLFKTNNAFPQLQYTFFFVWVLKKKVVLIFKFLLNMILFAFCF